MNPNARLIAAVSLTTAALGAQAQVSFGLGLNAGSMAYVIQSSTDQKWDGSAKVVVISGDLAFPGGFYGSLSHLQSQGGKEDFSFRGAPASNTSDFKRSDTAFTLGWSAANRLNTFVGFKSAETKIENAIRTTFSTTGYFAGLSYPISLGAGTLALTGAVGVNVGKWTDSGANAKENAVGVSGGLRYAYAFSPRISASAGIKAQRYSYDFQSTLGKKLEESVRVIDLGLNVNF
jgi:hypothetical protein